MARYQARCTALAAALPFKLLVYPPSFKMLRTQHVVCVLSLLHTSFHLPRKTNCRQTQFVHIRHGNASRYLCSGERERDCMQAAMSWQVGELWHELIPIQARLNNSSAVLNFLIITHHIIITSYIL